jgi:hypothetical protein
MTRPGSAASLPTPWLSLVRMFSVDAVSMADLNQFEMPRHSIKDQVELCTDTESDSASPYSISNSRS